MACTHAKSLSVVSNSVTLRTVAYKASMSMGFSRQEYWSGLPFLSPGDLPDPEMEPAAPALQADSVEPPVGKHIHHSDLHSIIFIFFS